MVGAEKKSSDFDDGGRCVRSVKVVPGAEIVKANGVAVEMKAGSSSSRSGLVTYKRRRTGKGAEDGVIWDCPVNGKSIRPLFDRDSKKSLDDRIASNGCSLKYQRNTVLEQICQSLEIESDLTRCMRSALAFDPGSGSKTTFKESVHSCGDGCKCTLHAESLSDGLQNAAKVSLGMTSSESVHEPSHDTVTELCRCTFSDIIMSEKFGQLCSLLLENFQGVRVNKLFDLSDINSRMKERAYEKSPALFHSDVQQIWTMLQKVGTDIIALAKCLSDRTTVSFREQLGSSAHSISENGTHQFFTQESDMHAKEEPVEAYDLNEVHTCKRCQEKTDGRNGLVCDSCEEMYHLSCIEPAIKEIPIRSWYCSNCTAKGIESPHDNCVVCERLNSSRPTFCGSGEDQIVHEESPEELEESSNELVDNEGGKRFPQCKTCRNEVRNDEDYRICGHSFCSHKFYHVRCLTNKQLISYGPCWYCPSCLCRSCFTDRDDDKIVLCDGCDHAYHIYCMHPPRTAVPKGKWFCKTCDAGIQRVRRAKRSFENMRRGKKAIDGNLRREDALNKSGVVDMILSAAKTLNYEENLAAVGL